MNGVIEIIEKFEGIIGALLGVIVTLLLTNYLKRLGKLKFYIRQSDVNFRVKTSNEIGETVLNDVESKISANFLSVELNLEVYNSSDSPKILRDVKFSLYKDQNKKLEVIPEDKSTEKFSAHRYHREEFGYLNIKPKEISSLFLVYYFDRDQMDTIKICNRIYLEGKDNNNKMHKVLLSKF